MVDARDVGAVAAALLLQQDPVCSAGVYDVTGPEAVTMQQVADEMSSAWGVHVRCEHVDMSGALQELVSAGVMPDSAVKSLGNFLECIGNECDFIDTAATVDVAGAQPTSLSQFVRDYRRAFEDAE